MTMTESEKPDIYIFIPNVAQILASNTIKCLEPGYYYYIKRREREREGLEREYDSRKQVDFFNGDEESPCQQQKHWRLHHHHDQQQPSDDDG
jgi:hypothetical protein